MDTTFSFKAINTDTGKTTIFPDMHLKRVVLMQEAVARHEGISSENIYVQMADGLFSNQFDSDLEITGTNFIYHLKE